MRVLARAAAQPYQTQRLNLRLISDVGGRTGDGGGFSLAASERSRCRDRVFRFRSPLTGPHFVSSIASLPLLLWPALFLHLPSGADRCFEASSVSPSVNATFKCQASVSDRCGARASSKQRAYFDEAPYEAADWLVADCSLPSADQARPALPLAPTPCSPFRASESPRGGGREEYFLSRLQIGFLPSCLARTRRKAGFDASHGIAITGFAKRMNEMMGPDGA